MDNKVFERYVPGGVSHEDRAFAKELEESLGKIHREYKTQSAVLRLRREIEELSLMLEQKNQELRRLMQDEPSVVVDEAVEVLSSDYELRNPDDLPK